MRPTLSRLTIGLVSVVITFAYGSLGQKPEIRKDLPIVDLPTSRSQIDKRREKTNRLYDISDDVLIDRTNLAFNEDHPIDMLNNPVSHGGTGPLPAYPSHGVLSGVVISKQAFISNDKTAVYSEFEMKIDEVFKGNSSDLAAGRSVRFTRRGGKVRLPSGKVLVRGGGAETMPEIGGRYVMFLRFDPQSESYWLLTGHEIRNGTVYPLDSMGTSTKPKEFAVFQGMTETEFFRRLSVALADK